MQHDSSVATLAKSVGDVEIRVGDPPSGDVATLNF